MSSETRKYELRARAESQRETRDTIARVAAGLHEEIGVARTTVAEIARRAGVSRLTVYNHFPDLEALLPACTAHFATQHPMPELGPALAVDDPEQRVRGVLGLLYGWYRETATLWRHVLGDRASVPELDRFLAAGIDTSLREIADGLAGRLDDPTEEQRALLRLAVDFWTWSRLTGDGASDDGAAGLMSKAVLGL